jgi:Fe-S-cluster-containing dehydrogenase component/DMSO reductase anchor subunit
MQLQSERSQQPTSLVAALLAEQQELTVVSRFARIHESSDLGTAPDSQGESCFAAPAQARYYRDLIPLSVPAADEQYGFTVDLDACSGCKACVTACHSLNGLDDDETFRDVGLLLGRDGRGQHVLQHVSTACHHCLEPACLHGCPTQAYDKDPVTGIVRHLDDQCIGCQYCTLTCPYDVPKYNPAKGIVRKCDMCRQRLDDGEAPACVQACPSQAIRIELVSREAVAKRALSDAFLPAAPDPRITLPTTRFISGREQLRDVAPPTSPLRPAHPHLPLVLMLVLTQWSIGLFVFAPLVADPSVVLLAAVLGLLGLAVSLLHLGRPQIAYRAWLGWRTSWMSREIIAFAAWSLVAGGFVAATLLGAAPTPRLLLWGLTTIAGAVALGCSAMIYVATQREFWSLRRTLPRFLITAVLLGLAGVACTQSLTMGWVSPTLLVAIAAAAAWRLVADHAVFRHRDAQEESALSRSSELLSGPLIRWERSQAFAALIGGILVPLIAIAQPQQSPMLTLVAASLVIAAEFIQRGLFFAAASPPSMPGVIPS